MPTSMYPKGSASYIHRLNKIKILNLIRRKKSVSRSEIAKLARLSAPSVTRIVDDLTNEHRLIKEAGQGESSGGRRPSLIQLDDDNNYIIGIQVGSEQTICVLTDINTRILQERKIPTRMADGFDSVMQDISDLIIELIGDSDLEKSSVTCAGIAVPGTYNHFTRELEISSEMPWENVPICSKLSRLTGLNTVCGDYATCAAIGEHWLGQNQGLEHMACILVQNKSVEACVIISGDIFFGADGRGIQLGHIPLDMQSGASCSCGNHGCLQAMVSNDALLRELESRMLEGGQSALNEICGGNPANLSMETVIRAAQQNDPLTIDIIRRMGGQIGIAAITLAHLFHPQALFIGGDITAAGDIFFNAIYNVAAKAHPPEPAGNFAIIPLTHSGKSIIQGAAALALRSILNLQFDFRD